MAGFLWRLGGCRWLRFLATLWTSLYLYPDSKSGVILILMPWCLQS
jgi:hypothetical protein